jgi:hypothetical protein
LFQHFLNLWSSQRDMSGPRLGTLVKNRWSWGTLISSNPALFLSFSNLTSKKFLIKFSEQINYCTSKLDVYIQKMLYKWCETKQWWCILFYLFLSQLDGRYAEYPTERLDETPTGFDDSDDRQSIYTNSSSRHSGCTVMERYPGQNQNHVRTMGHGQNSPGPLQSAELVSRVMKNEAFRHHQDASYVRDKSQGQHRSTAAALFHRVTGNGGSQEDRESIVWS